MGRRWKNKPICDWIWEMCIVDTSDFAHLEVHKKHRKWYVAIQFWKDKTIHCISIISANFIPSYLSSLEDFMSLKLIVCYCVNYAHFFAILVTHKDIVWSS